MAKFDLKKNQRYDLFLILRTNQRLKSVYTITEISILWLQWTLLFFRRG